MLLAYVNNKSNFYHNNNVGRRLKDRAFDVPSVIQHKSRLTI
jgi:hypothetical protein